MRIECILLAKSQNRRTQNKGASNWWSLARTCLRIRFIYRWQRSRIFGTGTSAFRYLFPLNGHYGWPYYAVISQDNGAQKVEIIVDGSEEI